LKKLVRIGVASLAKHVALVNALLGAVVGALYLALGLIVATAGDAERGIALVVWGIACPIASGIGGFLGGAIWAWIYDRVAERLGGIELELT
jgi:hypothetical protein